MLLLLYVHVGFVLGAGVVVNELDLTVREAYVIFFVVTIVLSQRTLSACGMLSAVWTRR